MHWRDRLGTMRSPIRATLHSPLFPAGANPFLSLFGSGAYKGVWFDPSDLTTIYTDRAGTTLATMPGLGSAVTIGKWLDKSGAGNHMSVTADSKRPTLSARANRLTYTEAQDNAAWTKVNSSITETTATAPNGTATACKWVPNNGATLSAATYLSQSVNPSPNAPARLLLRIKAAGLTRFVLQDTQGSGCSINLDAFTVAIVGTATNASITALGSDWYEVAVSTPGVGGSTSFFFYATAGTANGTNGCYLWGTDGRRSCDAIAGIPVYQRVVDALTYDTTGFPLFALFDGTDDAGQTPSIDFTATDKMTVFAGVTKLSDAAAGTVAELSATIASNNGTFLLSVPNSAAANLNWSSKGTSQVDNTVTTYTAPTSRVIAATGDISAPSNIIRVNGAQVGSVATSQGSGNYGNFVLNIGMRNNASVPFNGRLYHLVVVGRACSAGEISAAESAINAKMGRVY